MTNLIKSIKKEQEYLEQIRSKAEEDIKQDQKDKLTGKGKKNSKGKLVKSANQKLQTIALATSLLTKVLPVDEMVSYLVKQTRQCQLLAEGVNYQLSLGFVSVIDAERIVCIFEENKELANKLEMVINKFKK